MLNIRLKNDKINTDLQIKPTETCQYLQYLLYVNQIKSWFSQWTEIVTVKDKELEKPEF